MNIFKSIHTKGKAKNHFIKCSYAVLQAAVDQMSNTVPSDRADVSLKLVIPA